MSKFVNVPRPSTPPGIGSDFLQEQLAAQEQQQAPVVPEMSQAAVNVPPPLPYTGMVADEETDPNADYYARERQLFNDDYLDQFGQDNLGDLYPDAELGAGRPIMDSSGNELPVDQVLQIREQELENQRRSVMSLAQLTRIKNEEDLIEAIGPGVMKATATGAPIRASRDIGLALINQTVKDDASEEVNSITRLADAYGVTTRSAANFGTLAMTQALPLVVGNSKRMKPRERGDRVDEDFFFNDDSSDALSSVNQLFAADGEGPVDIKFAGGMLTRESYETIQGRMANLFRKTRNAVDANGRPIDQSTVPSAKISNAEAGAIYTQAQIDAGFLMEMNVSGVPTIIQTDKGLNYYKDAKELEYAITGKLSARSQKVPVTDTGERVGAYRNTRPGDIKGSNYQELTQIKEGEYVAGSIGKLSSPIKGFHLLNMFKMLLDQVNNNGIPQEGNMDVLKFFKISGADLEDAKLPDNNPSKKDTLKSKLNLLASEFFHQAGFMADGTPNFTKYRESYSTHRLYQDAVDFNEQRNKLTRALMVYSTKPMFVNGTNYHETGVSLSKAKEFYDKIGSKARGRDFKLSPAERELSFLALVGRVLDVGKYAGTGIKTENMTVPEMLSIVTPAFLQNAGAIGRQLRSLVPSSTKEIVNEILSVAKVVDEKYNRGVKKIPGDAKLIQPIYTESMSEQQKNAVMAWLNSSDRDDYGYKLQALLDIAAYLDAKEQGKPFTPRTTVAIDMNSAGRTFLAMDVGKDNILRRVGLIWDAFQDKPYQDVTGGEDPRAFFTRVALSQGLESAFGASDRDRIRVWEAAFARYTGDKAFNKAFGKKVLLTTDYGKPMMYHFEEAMDFLDEYPEFKADLMEFYDNDYNKVVEELNDLYHATLKATGDDWQYALPKQLVELMQMFGRVPAPVGFYGEKISIGKPGVYDSEEEITVRGRFDEVKRKKKKVLPLDPEAKAKDKRTKAFDGTEIEAPGPGTAARNGIGPVMGQYRESIVVNETLRYINSDKNPAQMLNMSPVFDNFILDTDSYLLTLYTANNIIVPRIMKWNMAKNFAADFALQKEEIDKELDKAGNTIVINDKSPYKGILSVLDNNYKYVKDKDFSKLSPMDKAFRKFLESPTSGYIPKENRPDNIILTNAQIRKLFSVMHTKFNINEKLKKWIGDMSGSREEAVSRMLERASRGEIYFFT